MGTKNGGKAKYCQYTLQIPKSGSKILSKLHHFRDKCIFALYAEIQDGQKRKSDFCEKSPVDYADTLQVKTFVKIALSHTVSDKCAFVFCAEIQDGHQKWRESDF